MIEERGFCSSKAQFERWTTAVSKPSTAHRRTLGAAVVMLLVAATALILPALVVCGSTDAHAKREKRDRQERRERRKERDEHKRANELTSGGGVAPALLAPPAISQKPVSTTKTDGQKNESKKDDGKKDSNAKSDEPEQDDAAVDEAPPETAGKLIEKLMKPPTPRAKRVGPGDVKDLADLAKLAASHRRNDDIITTGISAETRDALKLQGFQEVSQSNMPSLGMNVVRLRPPKNMPQSVVNELMREQRIIGGFHKNETYIIYGPSDDSSETRDYTPHPGPRAGQCREDRCYGREAICWDADIEQKTSHKRIGIIDTAIDISHPAFVGRTIKVGTFIGASERSASDWHGTAVLSILAGSPESGVLGLAPDAEFYAAEAFRTDPDGIATTDTASLLKALEWLEGNNVTLVNMSFSGPKDVLVEKAIQRMRKRGVTFVAAAGNFGPTAPASYPAAYDGVIAVTAVNKNGSNYFAANRGNYIDLAAPGVRVWMALPDGKEGYRTGTSFAAPFVTALLAAFDIRSDAKVPTLDLGPPGDDQIYGRGLAVTSRDCRNKVARNQEPVPDASPTVSFPSFEAIVKPEPAAVPASGFAP